MRKDDRDENQYLYGNCKKQRKRKSVRFEKNRV